MLQRLISISCILLLSLSNCEQEEEFSCNGKGEFKINNDRFCASINVLRHNDSGTSEIIEMGISGSGLDLRLNVLVQGALIEENVEYAYVYGGSYTYQPVYFTVLGTAGINTVSAWATFTKFDRTNKLVSGTFRATWKDVDINGTPTNNEGSGSFTDIPYYN